MPLCDSRRKLGLLVLDVVYLCGYFTVVTRADVCSCQQYDCNTCPSTGSCSKINVALGKTARASSLFNSTKYNEMSGPACLAVNGNTGTEFKPINKFPNNSACVHTADGDYTPYWEVDLGQQYIISSITVYGRQQPGTNMLRKATVSVDDKLCYTFPPNYLQPVIADISCDPPLTGRKIKLQKINDTGLPFIGVCQVQVLGCKSGFYGSDCTNTCGNCSAGTCEPSSGVCPQGCVAGYQAPYCKDTCKPGTYGEGCKETCGNCYQTSACNLCNGLCEFGCVAGYSPPLCQLVCSSGYYGTDCNKTCGNCSEGTTCDAVSGVCPNGCKNGIQGEFCNETQTDRHNECASTVGPIVGAVCGSIAGCVVGFLLGMLFVRRRLLQRRDVKSSLTCFPPMQTDSIPSLPEESRPPRKDPEEYKHPGQPANVYDSLKTSRDDNIYTNLN